jgi:hypothetical protein
MWAPLNVEWGFLDLLKQAFDRNITTQAND